MATTPTFDPNDPGKAAPNALGDPAVSDVYEPGSVNKVITVAAALQDGLVTPDTPMTVPPYLRIAGRVFQDAEPHGTEQLTVTGVLAKSSNIGAIEIEQKLGAARFYNYLRSFGFGQSTGVGLPGESPGILPPSNLWNGSQQYTIAFGQGISVTALQVASVYATVANHGLRVVPTIVRGTIGPDGRLRPLARPGPRQVITASVAKQVANMLEAVTSDEGTAPKARIAGYRVAGKTGTAMRVDPTCGCYRGYTATFVGFAPADNPRLLVEVVLQNPQRGHFGGAVAAPVFHQVMAFALESLRIPPTGTPPPVARLTPG
jgi:cell division protein FtsI (penicillin-binding protein 3)